jgi:hypothetical protein
MKLQSASQVVDIASWQVGEFVYPEGAREKSLLYCPENPPHDFLLPSRAYLFKHSSHNYPEQFWVEVIAYQLGCLMGVPVPPAFVAFHSETGKAGAIVEWFLESPEMPVTASGGQGWASRLFRQILAAPGIRTMFVKFVERVWPDLVVERYVPGGDFMQRIIPDFDRKRGTQHNWEDTRALCKTLQKANCLMEGWEMRWAEIFVFDALVGNTDRHQDNWGTIWRFTHGAKVAARITPAFDNGTSMGHELDESKFPAFLDDARALRYVQRGTHHMKWRRSDKDRLSHSELLRIFCAEHPNARQRMLECLSFDPALLEPMVHELTKCVVPVKLSEPRARLIVRLLTYRHRYLISQLETK